MGVYMNVFLSPFSLLLPASYYDDVFCYDFCLIATFIFGTSADLTYILYTVWQCYTCTSSN